ncbi:MAG: OmpA family protein [Saprospiraceae bacterium]|nr:OmpA family protein [Saprospiraceae bacterium]
MTRKILSVLSFSLVALSLTDASAQKAAASQDSKAKYGFFAPNNQTELGIHAGLSYLVGDLEAKPGVGVGLHLRKALDYTFSLRADVGFSQLNSVTPNSADWRYGGEETRNLYGGGDLRSINKTNTSALTGGLQVVISLNNGRWDAGARKVNPYVFGGAGASYLNTQVNVTKTGGQSGAKTGDQEFVVPGTRNTGKLVPNVEAGAGISFRINDKMSFSIEEKLMTVFGKRADLLDAFQYNFRDFQSYTNLRLGFNLGAKNKQTMPLWWAGPADQMNADIAELKARPKYDPTDTDGDGVVDMIDQEKDSPTGARVDTRGVSLDSDGDGYADFKDKEPFSPVGYKVDGNGVAQVPKPAYVTEADVNRIVEAQLAKFKASLGETKAAPSMADWFLPMIHFDLNSASVKTSEYANLAAVASVMKTNPSVRVAVTGFTDKLASDGYNQGLSYRRAQAAIDALVKRFGVDRSRLVLTYQGEDNTLVPTSGNSMMNRRVEFKVATTESEMSAPTSIKKKSYKGNKSGY